MKLFGYSISLNVLILIGILYLIMIVNALSAACNREGLVLNTKPITADQVSNELNNLISAVKKAKKPLSTQDQQDITKRIEELRTATRDPRMLYKITQASKQMKQYGR
jgi:hypothetical protein